MSGDKIPEDHVAELTECFAAHAPGVFGYACVLACGDRALAEDLVQSTFVAAAGPGPCPAAPLAEAGGRARALTG